jgi:hypothetical protein
MKNSGRNRSALVRSHSPNAASAAASAWTYGRIGKSDQACGTTGKVALRRRSDSQRSNKRRQTSFDDGNANG